MTYRIDGLDPAPFAGLFGADAATLAAHGVARIRVDGPGHPDRVTLRDARPGETVLLLNHVSVPDGPFRASHAIYVIEGADRPWHGTDTLPPVFRGRALSLRAFDARWMLRDAVVVAGDDADAAIRRLLDDPETKTIHAHYAAQGCYAARILRG